MAVSTVRVYPPAPINRYGRLRGPLRSANGVNYRIIELELSRQFQFTNKMERIRESSANAPTLLITTRSVSQALTHLKQVIIVHSIGQFCCSC